MFEPISQRRQTRRILSSIPANHSVHRAPRLRILMVCLGNICRSPTAHGVLEKFIENKEISSFVEVDSAGTSDYHLGRQPDSRSISAAACRGYELENQTARQVQAVDFHEFDYLLAMDRENLNELQRMAPAGSKARIQLLLDYSSAGGESVPDPYFGDDAAGFERVLDLVEGACEQLLKHLEQQVANLAGRG